MSGFRAIPQFGFDLFTWSRPVPPQRSDLGVRDFGVRDITFRDALWREVDIHFAYIATTLDIVGTAVTLRGRAGNPPPSAGGDPPHSARQVIDVLQDRALDSAPSPNHKARVRLHGRRA